jgi:hypothetical protein
MDSPKGSAFWSGIVLDVRMGVLFLIALGILLHDGLVAR